MINHQWTIPDLIDLEFFLDKDDGQDIDVLTARDRQIYAQIFSENNGILKEASPAVELYQWLVARREALHHTNPETPLPGRVWHELMLLLGWGTLFSGLFSGAGLAFSFLSYSGTRPVNVSTYFGIFVLLEVVFLVVLLALSVYRHLLGQGLEVSVFYRTLRNVFFRLIDRVGQKTHRGTSAAICSQWSAFSVTFRKLQRQYGALMMRPFFLIAQLFGVSFNAGILAATLLKVIGSDIAFGWQTTLQVQGKAVYSLVRFLSFPWRWAIPQGVPSLEQIEGSQLILKDGIYHMATQNLVSWWPFLCLSVLFYGLLPRLVLLLSGLFQQRRDLRQLRFDHGKCRQVLHRMKTPVVSTVALAEKIELSGVAEQVPSASMMPPEEMHPSGQDIESAQAGRKNKSVAVIAALIPDELVEDFPFPELKNMILKRLGYQIVLQQPFWTLDQTEDQELATVNEKMEKEKCEDVLLLQEAWQPPIQEFFSLLKRVRNMLGEQATIFVVLIGKPAPETMLTPVDRKNLQIWQQKMSVLADPGLQLIELVK